MKRIEYPNGTIGLRPEAPNEWVYADTPEDVKRDFVPSVTTTPADEPNWHECTDADKVTYEQAWADSHPQPEESTEEPTQEGGEV